MDETRPLASLRFDQVGSLLRPEDLKQAFAAHTRGEIDGLQLEEIINEAVATVIAKQEYFGLPLLTDGEYRRLNFQDSFASAVSGFSTKKVGIEFYEKNVEGGQPLQRWESGAAAPGPAIVNRLSVIAPLQLTHNLLSDEYRYAKGLTARPVTVALIGPDRISQRFDQTASNEVYGSTEEFLEDVVAIERQIVNQLVAAGCRYVHIDEPGYTAYVDPPSLQAMIERGETPEANLSRSIAADNAIIANFPDTVFGVHLCRGNQASMWHREGTYDAIAEQLFGSLDHDRFLLEYDSERAGGFEPLRFVPPGKIAVLGLVSSKVPELESRDEIVRRIEEASSFLPIDQLALSAQCGFASDINGNRLSEEDQWRKFELILDVVEQVWG